MINDTPERYGTVTRFLHWLMAILVVWQLLKLGDRIQEGEHWIGQTLVPWHVSVGVLILVLAVIRLIWALKQRPQRPKHVGSRTILIKGGHFLLYAVMILLPITGTLYLLGNGYGVTFFDMELIAKPEGETPWMATVGSLHSPLAWILLVLVIGHIGAALYHHFIERDDTLKRIAG